MSLMVVGSVAIDSIESPHGSAPEILGGSATHFSMAATLLCPVRLVGVVGADFPEAYLEVLRQRVDLAGLERSEGRTFRWRGRYQGTMAQAETLAVELNAFGSFEPKVPESFADSRFVFLANGAPSVQRRVVEQVAADAYCVMDTMNLWIDKTRDELVSLIREVPVLFINDEEIRSLTGERNLMSCARKVRELGPETVIVKKGEHGALLFHGEQVFAAPAYPVETVKDPTGAGDSFAGGFMGAIAASGRSRPSFQDLRLAMCVGVVASSFNVEDFGPRRLHELDPGELRERFRRYRDMLRIDGEPAVRDDLVHVG